MEHSCAKFCNVRSTSGLARYPRPNVAVDVAILTVLPAPSADRPGSLAVLVQQPVTDASGWALPGRFLREGQTVADAVRDVLRVKAGLTDVRPVPRLLRVFDDPGRDPRAWTLSLAHSLTLTARQLVDARGELVGVNPDGELADGRLLLFDHDLIVTEAAAATRERYEYAPDPDGLLERPFTMAELRTVHEAVIGERLLKDTFRRRMEPLLQPFTDADGQRVLRSDGGRPAQVYVRPQEPEPNAAVRRRLLLPRAQR